MGQFAQALLKPLLLFHFHFWDLAVEASINWTSRDVGVKLLLLNDHFDSSEEFQVDHR